MIIRLKSGNFEEEVLQSENLVMVLIWDYFSVPCERLRAEQNKMDKQFGRYLKFTQFLYSDDPDLFQRLPAPFRPRVIPQVWYIYKGCLIQSTMMLKAGDISLHLNWLHNYCNDYKLFHPRYQVTDETMHPEAAGWCTPGVNC